MNSLWLAFCVIVSYALVDCGHPYLGVTAALFLTPIRWETEEGE